MDQLAKILVLGQENASLPEGKPDNRLVVGSWRQVGDGQNFVSRPGQRTDDGVVAALVGQEARQRSPARGLRQLGGHGFFARNRIRRKDEAGVDVLLRQPRAGVEQLVGRRPFTELAKDQLDRDTGVRDHRLSQHDIGVDLDTT